MDAGTIQNLRKATRGPQQRRRWKCAATLTTCEECDWVRSYRYSSGVNTRMPEKFLAKMSEHWITRFLLIGGQYFGRECVSETPFEGIVIHCVHLLSRSVNQKQITLPCSKPNGQDWPFAETQIEELLKTNLISWICLFYAEKWVAAD